MDTPADFKVVETDGGRGVALTGDWTVTCLNDAPSRLSDLMREDKAANLNLKKVGRVDTAGAYALIKAVRQRSDEVKIQARPETQRLLELIGEAVKADRKPPRERRSFADLMERLGRGVVGFGHDAYETMAFNGHLLVVTWRAVVYLFRSLASFLLKPFGYAPRQDAKAGRIRWAAFVSLAERAGLDAIPIVAITSFFIGAVVALLGANMLADVGAQVFAVEGVGFGVLREFNIVITAVLLAGRSASSFAAEVGAMKMNQEIDAMRVLGVDPFEALVLPRFLALLFTIPLLTFIATVAGLFGGAMVLWAALDLAPPFFMQRIIENVGLTQFWIGMCKAPFMAVVIAAIGCRQGMEVGGDVESLGRRVTAAVVHAIFSIIFLDAVFALIFMELDI